MDVTVGTRNTHIAPRLRTVVQHKLDRFDRMAGAMQAEVHFSEERNPRIPGRFTCTAILRLHHGSMTAHASAPEPIVAFDRVVEKLRHQLDRRKDLLVRRAHAARRRSPGGRTRS